MTINIHPIFVHFPIALLTLYALSELLYIPKIRSLSYTFYCKAIVVILGTISAYVTLQTGDLAAEGLKTGLQGRLIETHEQWANITTGIFTVLAAAYLIAWLNKTPWFNAWLQKQMWLRSIWKLLSVLSNTIIGTPLIIVFALAGLAAVTITGALGGSLVYGPDTDPVVSFIYKLLIQ